MAYLSFKKPQKTRNIVDFYFGLVWSVAKIVLGYSLMSLYVKLKYVVSIHQLFRCPVTIFIFT